MRRPSATSTFGYSFGPGPLTPAVKAIILANVAMFLAEFVIQRTAGISLNDVLGLRPVAVSAGAPGVAARQLHVPARWRVPHSVQHARAVDVRRRAGANVGQPIFHQVLFRHRHRRRSCAYSREPDSVRERAAYVLPTVGASGAIYGILLAYAMYFPNRPICMYFVFPIPAKYFVLIIGAISFLAATDGSGGWRRPYRTPRWAARRLSVSEEGPAGVHLLSEIKYRYLKWRINRMRRRFDVYSGGRANDVDRRVH